MRKREVMTSSVALEALASLFLETWSWRGKRLWGKMVRLKSMK